jgi:SAM-dependent methyltransferase
VSPTRSDAAFTPSPLVYAGRLADEVPAEKLSGDCRVLDDWHVLPFQLRDALEDATALVVLDPFSFPFEAMTAEQRDFPLVVVLPPGSDAPFLRAVFGELLFETLGPFDRVATADGDLWDDLRREYRWTEGQRIELDGTLPAEAASQVCARLEEEGAGRAAEKAVYRVRNRALAPRFASARGVRDADVPFDVLGVGAGSFRWTACFDPATTGFAGLATDRVAVEAAPAEFPGHPFDLPGKDLTFPHADESFDLAFTAGFLHHHPVAEKEAIVAEMWRVVRTGGTLIFVEDFVAGGADHVVSIQAFVEVVVEATSGRVVMEHFEALRYPEDPFFRGGLLALAKVGTPRTW